MGRKVRMAALTLAGVLTFSACGGPSASGNTPTGEVSFGAIIGQSGIYGEGGPALIAGVQVAADKINKAGGITAGGKKLNVKIVIQDDRSDPQVAVADAVQMFRDNKIKVLFGPIALGATAVAPIADQNHVINVTPALVSGTHPLLFFRQPSTPFLAGVVVSAVKQFYPNAKTIAIVAPNDAAEQIYVPILTTQLQGAGLTALDFMFPSGTADLSTVATKVAAAKPDVVWATTSVEEVVNVMRSLDAAGVPKSVPVFSYGGDVSAQANGRPVVIFFFNAVDVVKETTPEISAFKQALFAKNGGPIADADLPLAQFYYFAMQLVAEAMTKANSTTDTTAIAKEMVNVSLTEFGTRFQWSADDHHMKYANVTVSYSASGQATIAHLSPP